LAWKRLQLEGGIRIRQQIENGWFTSPEEKAQARRERAMLEAERDRMGRPSGPMRPFSQSFQNSLDAFISNATDTGGGSTTTSKQSKAAAARAAREAARLAKEIERNQRAYEADLDSVRREELQLRGQLTGDVRERARLEHEQITLAYETRDREINNLLVDKDIDKAKAERLRLENERLTSLRHAVVNRGLDEQLAELDVRALEDRRATLESDAELVTTREARLAIEKSILDLMEQEERARLETAIAAGQVADAEQARANLTRRQAARRISVGRQNGSPLEQYRQQVADLGNSINDQLERVQVDGLQSLNDGLVDAIMNAKSLGSVFKNVANQIIADILRIAIRQAIIAPLLGGLGGGGLSSIFGGFFAGGGSPPVGKVSVVGERGPELFVPRQAGVIVPNHALSRSGTGAQQITVVVQANDYFDARVAGISQQVAVPIAQSAAIQAAGAMGQTVMKGVPSRLAQFQRDGT
jgi:hypothetical protein